MLRYPHSTEICQNCQERVAVYNDHYCGACAEMLGRPEQQPECKSCGAPHGVLIYRSLAVPRIWIKARGGSNDEPGFGRSRRNQVLASGLCRFCSQERKVGG